MLVPATQHHNHPESLHCYTDLLRGIPAMRYQGEKMLLAEMQVRWEFIDRWNLVAFGGAGKVYGNEYRFDILQKGIQNVPDMGIFHHALGLWYVRNKESGKAVVELKKATE